jgi:hypothetical protein
MPQFFIMRQVIKPVQDLIFFELIKNGPDH